jgi:hypothetical protein
MAREMARTRNTVRNGKDSTHTRTYRIETQTSDSSIAMAELLAVIAGTPSVIVDNTQLDQTLPTVENQGGGRWVGQIQWSHKASTRNQHQSENLSKVGHTVFTVDLTTEQDTQRLSLSAYDENGTPATAYPIPGQTLPGYDYQINVTDMGIQGVGVLRPAGTFQIQKVFAYDTVFATNWIQNRAAKRCKVNDADYQGWPAGTLLFTRMGFTVRQGREGDNGPLTGDILVTFNFQQRDNFTGTVAGVAGVEKKGHEYLWISQKKTTVQNAAGKDKTDYSQDGIFVAKVYEEADFSTLISETP